MGNAIAFRQKSGTVFIDMAAAGGTSDNFGSPARKMQGVLPPEKFEYMPWAIWGNNNLLPQEMVRDMEKIGRAHV